MTIETHEKTSREQWLEMRRQDLTASDLAAYLGMTPWKSPAELFAEKMGLNPIPKRDSFMANENGVMRRGRRDEYAILRILQEVRPKWDIAEAKVYVRDSDIRLGCTPDAMAVDPGRPGTGIVQCKSVAADIFREKWQGGERDGPVTIPFPYHIQTLCEAMLTDCQWAVLAVWVRTAYTEDLKLIPVERDPVAEQNIRDLAVRFWNEVESGKLPDFDHTRDDKAIEAFFPKEDGDEIDLSQDNEAVALVSEYVDVRNEIKKHEERKKVLSAALKAKLGTAPAARIGDFKASWKSMERPEHLVNRWEGRVLRVTAPRKKRRNQQNEFVSSSANQKP